MYTWFDDAVSYTQQANGLQRSYGSDRIPTPVPGVMYLGPKPKELPLHPKKQQSSWVTPGCLGGVVVCNDLFGNESHRQVGVHRVVTSGSLVNVMVSVLVCTDLSGKEPHRQVGVGRMVTSGGPRWCNC